MQNSDHAELSEDNPCTDPSCQACGLDFDVSIPPSIVRDALAGELVIFAGAGISTEARDVFPQTVYERASLRLDDTKAPGGITFPEVMEAYQEEFGRKSLIELILQRFRDIEGFRRSREMARSFHKELSTLPMVTDIITTNWDTYFEEECGATAFVTGEDTALWNTAKRRVLKVHGSVANLGTIVATSSDYDTRMEELSKGAIGAFFRTLLATKTVVFVGYSLNDWNILDIYRSLIDDIKGLAPRAFVVDPFAAEPTNTLGMTVLRTSGNGFIKQLKAEIGTTCTIPDQAFNQIFRFEDRIHDALLVSQSISHSEHPHIFFNWMYHDGARDACDRISRHKKTGEYSDRHRIGHMLHTYSDAQERAKSDGNWEDYAYIEGYLNTLILLMAFGTDDEHVSDNLAEEVPVHFIFDSDANNAEFEIDEVTALADYLNQAYRENPHMTEYLEERLKGVPANMVLVHGPTLRNLQ